MHDGGSIYNLSANPGTVIEDNYMYNNNSTVALYLDEGSRYLTVSEQRRPGRRRVGVHQRQREQQHRRQHLLGQLVQRRCHRGGHRFTARQRAERQRPGQRLQLAIGAEQVISQAGIQGSSSSAPTGPITSGDDSAKCVDDNAESSADGTKIQIWDCNGGANQQWTVESNGTVQVYGKCMDITGANYSNGTLIELWTATAAPTSNGRPATASWSTPPPASAWTTQFNTANGTQLDLWTCNGGSNQQWSIP